jgi:hypothetical protein
MKLDEAQRAILVDVGSQILDALESVALEAKSRLGTASHPSDPTQLLAVNTNLYVHGNTPTINRFQTRLAEARENLQRLVGEPFIARVVVTWGSAETETIYFARASAVDVAEAIPGARVITYRAALGGLAEHEAGDEVTIVTPLGKRTASVKERIRLRPLRREGEWDSLDSNFDFDQWTVALDSVRAFLKEIAPLISTAEAVPDLLGELLQEGSEALLVHELSRRRVIERMSLRDQPILDRYQGEVFRMPLDRRLLLLGPPGTGKTTTLIRRLAQKRTLESLSEHELEALLRIGIGTDASVDHTWAMFSPTELLKLYLRDAFNREGVPAHDNLRTWDKQRLDLARNTLGILRSASSGRFQMSDTLVVLADPSSAGGIRLFESFAADFEREVFVRLGDAYEALLSSSEPELSRRVSEIVGRQAVGDSLTIDHLVRILDRSSELQPALKRLDEEVSDEVRRIGNRVLREHSGLLAEIVEHLSALLGEDRDEDDEDDAEEQLTAPGSRLNSDESRRQLAAEIFVAALRQKARAITLGRTRLTGRAGRVLALVGDRLPPATAMSALGAKIVTRAYARVFVQAPRQFVMGVPAAYARFRARAFRDGLHFNPDAGDAIRQTAISVDEVDALVLAMLRNARRLMEAGRWNPEIATGREWLENIRSEHLTQVFVDEATDFSAVQLACTMELAHPRLRSWFACGDFDQRITENGIRNRSDVEWLEQSFGTSIDISEVRIGYRQSRRLAELTAALVGQSLPVDFPDWDNTSDVWPLLVEHHSGERLAQWLANRIVEIEAALGQLPSVAIFVEAENEIDPLVELLQPLLARHNLPVLACRDGRVVGDQQEVRVFDIRHVKGLEFEAVFFVGIDRLAERVPNLFDRLIYVGATRAATYLGLTCEKALPSALEGVRRHCAGGGWEHS